MVRFEDGLIQPAERMSRQAWLFAKFGESSRDSLCRFAMLQPLLVRRQFLLFFSGELDEVRAYFDKAMEQTAKRKAGLLARNVHVLRELSKRTKFLLHLTANGFALFRGFAVLVGVGKPLLGSLLEILNKRFLVSLRVVDQAAEFVQTLLPEAMEDNINCGTFFTNKEHAFSLRNIIRDEIGYGLGFTRAGGSLNDVTATGAGTGNGGSLGGITWNYHVLLRERQRRNRSLLRGFRVEREDAIKGFASEVTFDQLRIILHQRHLAIIKVSESDRTKIKIPEIRISFGFLLAIAERKHAALGFKDLASIVWVD